MIEEEFKLLLDKSWTDEEREMIKRIMDSLLYYKKLLPKSLKNDIIAALQLCNNLKHKIEIFETPLESIPEDQIGNDERG
jgi:hypothetical protein